MFGSAVVPSGGAPRRLPKTGRTRPCRFVLSSWFGLRRRVRWVITQPHRAFTTSSCASFPHFESRAGLLRIKGSAAQTQQGTRLKSLWRVPRALDRSVVVQRVRHPILARTRASALVAGSIVDCSTLMFASLHKKSSFHAFPASSSASRLS